MNELKSGEVALMEFYMNSSETTSGNVIEVIGDINQALQDERRDISYYRYLINIAPTAHEIEILYSIRHYERVHVRLLRIMYQELAGVEVSFDQKEKLVMPKSYLKGIGEALLREYKEVERYKMIREAFPSRSPYRDILSRIIADESNNILELKHILSLTRMSNDLPNEKIQMNSIQQILS